VRDDPVERKAVCSVGIGYSRRGPEVIKSSSGVSVGVGTGVGSLGIPEG
jgi:hypothetical protein